MQSRRDQAQAYRFVLHRVQSALLQGDPDAPEPPLRRIGRATFVSVMVGVLAIAAFGVFGLIRPGAKQGWRATGVLIVEKETGARFIYLDDGALHPVLNYASARLILNAADVPVRSFSRASLADAPRGDTRGRPGLPDALPAPGGLLTGPWTVCSGATGAVTVSVGFPVAGTRIGAGRGLLVRSPSQAVYLIWNDTRLQLKDPRSALTALRYDNIPPAAVADTWVNAVPPGPDLAAPLVPGRGDTPPYAVGSQEVRIGQVLKVAAEAGAAEQFWLVLGDGLELVSATTALLLLGDPGERQAYGGNSPQLLPALPVDVSTAPRSAAEVTPDGFPDQVPALADPAGGAVCAAYTDTSGESAAVAVSVEPAAPGVRPGVSAGAVLLPPGKAALARLLPHPDVPSDSTFLVTDSGAKFPVPADGVLPVLGYGGAVPVPVPGGVLGLIPTGPALDPAKVNTAVPAGVADPTDVPTGQSEQDGGA